MLLYKNCCSKEVNFISSDTFPGIMANITQVVWNLLTKDLTIQRNLRRDLINVRALAKYLISEHRLKASVDSVISAIRRYNIDEALTAYQTSIAQVLKGANISTRNNMACLVLRREPPIRKYLSQIAELTDFDKQETLRIIKAADTLKIITDRAHLPKLLETIPPQDRGELKENLSEIRLTISPKADETKGVAARISNELLIHNINISEIVFCVPEILVYIKQSDLLTAHESLIHLCDAKHKAF